MTRGEVIGRIATTLKLPTSTVRSVLDLWNDACISQLSMGEKVRIPCLGTFATRERAERKGRNPKTGEVVDIPAHKVVTYSMGKYAKDALNPQKRNRPYNVGGL